MRKKYTFLLVSLMALCSEFAWSAEKSAFMLTAAEEEARCELLYSLNGMGNLNCIAYAEYGVAFLDRDIAIIQKYAEKVLVNKKCAEGYWQFKIIPGFLKLMRIHSMLMLFNKFCHGMDIYCEMDEGIELIMRSLFFAILMEGAKIKLFSSAYNNYVSTNEVFIKEMQRRWEQGQVIIAQLNGIKKKVVDQIC